ncbi:MAG: hypothetical protein ABII24_02870 [bacterium]
MVIIVGGAFLIYRDQDNQASVVASLPFLESEQVTVTTEEVKGVADISESRVVMADREVIEVDGQGNNKYQYTFYLTDFTGAKKFKFYETDQLAYEPIVLLDKDRIAIYHETDSSQDRLIDFQGQPVDQVIPPFRFQGSVYSQDRTKLSFVEISDNEIGGDDLIIVNLADNNRTTIANSDFWIDDLQFPVIRPWAFNQDSSELFVQALLDDQNPATAYALFRVLLADNMATPFFQDKGEPEADKYYTLIGVYPDQGFALVDLFDSASLTDPAIDLPKIMFAKIDLNDGQLSNWTEQTGLGIPLNPLADPLSPNGRLIMFESMDQKNPGLVLWDIQADTLTRLTNEGNFLSWSPDSRFFMFETVDYEGTGEYTIFSYEIESNSTYQLVSQSMLSEGTGLNSVGDSFRLFLGVSS